MRNGEKTLLCLVNEAELFVLQPRVSALRINREVVLGTETSVPETDCVPKASLVAQRLKCLPGMRETLVRYLGWEDPLEKEMATHSSTLARKIPRTVERGRLLSMGSQSQT